LDFEWPAHYPHACPPADACPRDMEVYRAVSTDPPEDDSFVSARVQYPRRPVAENRMCQSCGISVVRTLAHLQRLWNAAPGLQKAFPLAAKGAIRPGQGVCMDTGPGHVTWWIPEGVSVCGQFEVVM